MSKANESNAGEQWKFVQRKNNKEKKHLMVAQATQFLKEARRSGRKVASTTRESSSCTVRDCKREAAADDKNVKCAVYSCCR